MKGNRWLRSTVGLFVLALLQEIPGAYGDEAVQTSAAVRRAEQAMEALQQRLQTRLRTALEEKGPAGAVSVCRMEAKELARAVANEAGFELGRTSHKLRNPANAPRAWVIPYLERAAGQPASSVRQVVVDLGDRIGVLRPIAAAGPCLICHGAPESFDPALRDELAKLYPTDRATGFREGEFRGFFWAEVPKPK